MQVATPSRPVVVIPAYQPSHKLVDLLRAVPAEDFPVIVVVDDGSGPGYRETFDEAAALPNVHLLRHAVNLGKGAALKTAFNHVLNAFSGVAGVVTAGAGGQHHPEDIGRVAAELVEKPECLVLGSRTFGNDVPLRSRIGNIATRGLLDALLGRKFTDTQTGLRGIPAAMLPHLLRLKSTGYEFELDMLRAAHQLSMTVVETPIRTIYGPDKTSSHFNPVIDFAVQRLFTVKPRDAVAEPQALADRPAPPFWGVLCALVFAVMVYAELHGFRTSNLFSQEIWFPIGLKRFLNYTGAYLALAVPLLLMVPWMFAGFITVLILGLSALAVGPQAVFATAFFLLSACALGSRLLGAKDHSAENHLLATLVGVAIYVILMTLVARQPVNYPAVWGGLLALPLLLDWRGVRDRFAFWLRGIRDAELRPVSNRAAFAFLLFVMIAHWFVALTPEASADGLAMHLAIPMDIAAHHRLTFEPARVIWSVMPMGADWCYAIVIMLGGEYAAHLLVWSMLAIVAGLLYGLLRRLASPTVSLLLVGLFASTPMVQYVTGSLFVENLLAAMILGMVTALWRFSETGHPKFLYLAMVVGGAALQIKLGAVAFLTLGLIVAGVEIVRHWKALGPRPWAVCAASLALVLAAALPPYAIAYSKTGNPLFPFLNPKFPSPLLERSVDLRDDRYHQPVRWNTLYGLTFRTTDYYEGQRGSFGFHYLLVVPLGLLGFPLIRRRGARAAGLIGFAAAILVLRSEPNARYFYPALPLLLVPFAAVLDWMAAHQRWVYRSLLFVLVVCGSLNAWFLPSSSYYHKEFSLAQPFSRAARERILARASPERDVIAWYNRKHAGSAVLFTHDSTIAGIDADIYANHWHQWPIYQRIHSIATVPEMLQLMKSWKIEYFIANKPRPGERIQPKALARLVELCAVPEYQNRDIYLARLDPACNPAAAASVAPAEPTIVVSPGFYDDSDPAIVFHGDWEHDETFAEPLRHTVSYSEGTGAEIRFAFDGKAVNWVFAKAPNRGIAEVTIDGIRREQVDLYGAVVAWQSAVRFCCFAPGKHVVVIRASGQSNAKAVGRYIDLDALIIE